MTAEEVSRQVFEKILLLIGERKDNGLDYLTSGPHGSERSDRIRLAQSHTSRYLLL
jgi:hypothetical protein